MTLLNQIITAILNPPAGKFSRAVVVRSADYVTLHGLITTNNLWGHFKNIQFVVRDANQLDSTFNFSVLYR